VGLDVDRRLGDGLLEDLLGRGLLHAGQPGGLIHLSC